MGFARGEAPTELAGLVGTAGSQSLSPSCFVRDLGSPGMAVDWERFPLALGFWGGHCSPHPLPLQAPSPGEGWWQGTAPSCHRVTVSPCHLLLPSWSSVSSLGDSAPASGGL